MNSAIILSVFTEYTDITLQVSLSYSEAMYWLRFSGPLMLQCCVRLSFVCL